MQCQIYITGCSTDKLKILNNYVSILDLFIYLSGGSMTIKEKVLEIALAYATGKMLDDSEIAYSSFGDFNFSINLYTLDGDHLFDTYIFIDCKNEECCAIDNYNSGDISVIEEYVEQEFNELATWASEISTATSEEAIGILNQSAEILDMSKCSIVSNFGNQITYSFNEITS